jgi:hypothetical protein
MFGTTIQTGAEHAPALQKRYGDDLVIAVGHVKKKAVSCPYKNNRRFSHNVQPGNKALRGPASALR